MAHTQKRLFNFQATDLGQAFTECDKVKCLFGLNNRLLNVKHTECFLDIHYFDVRVTMENSLMAIFLNENHLFPPDRHHEYCFFIMVNVL